MNTTLRARRSFLSRHTAEADDIAGMEPNATMVDGYSISRNSVEGSADGIREWLGRIGMSEQ